jgi:CRP-like cAMP-binding protein
MANDPKLDLFRGVPLFARLSGRELERLGELADEIDAPAGKVLLREGDFGHELFVVASGQVRVERGGRDLGLSGAGAVLGEIALLSEGRRTATVTVVEPTRLFVLGHREFHALMDEMPTVRDAVFMCVADRLRDLEAEVAH